MLFAYCMDYARIYAKCNAFWEQRTWIMLNMHDNVHNRAYCFKIATFLIKVGHKDQYESCLIVFRLNRFPLVGFILLHMALFYIGSFTELVLYKTRFP